jgi:class 3 adenylate cyclase/tetratricopeptide (TPR) repeat protein
MDVGEWLRGLGLAQYELAFRDNNIDDEVLRRLTADDLRDLGVASVGHRRRLLDALDALGEETPNETLGKPLTRDVGVNAERRQLSVMFCDLVGSTALAAQLDPEDLRELIGAYHAAAADEIRRLEGHVAQYLGDGVLAYFGYPQAHENDAERAVRVGLRLVERIGALDAGQPLQIRVAIATGLVVVGDLIGTGETQERGAVGETPNLAARLQAIAPPNGVLIDETTRSLVGDLFDYRDLGLVEARGIKRKVGVLQVLGANPLIENRFDALRGTALTPLVGRREEIEMLMRRWRQANAGNGQVVIVSGEPGIGKSRLASSLRKYLGKQPHTLLRYSSSEQHRDTALYPVIHHMERAAGFSREDAISTRLDKLELLLAGTTDSIAKIAGLFADLLGLTDQRRYPALPRDPQRRRNLILEGLTRQVETLARRQPVLMIFEDAHWADSTSIEFIDRTIEALLSLPILLVITSRPEFAAPWVGQAHASVLSLNRLARPDIAAMINGITAGKKLPTEIVDAIAERTDGIPLFVEELTRSLLEGDLMRETDNGYALDVPLPPLAVPSSLNTLLLARLDRLPGVKEVAQAGAAIGRDFSYELVASVARCGEPELRAGLVQLTDAGLIFSRGTPPRASYRFKHALVRDAAYSTLLRAPRQKLHAAIAQALEQFLANNAEQSGSAVEQAASLADHWFKAGSQEKAFHYSLKAAKEAARVYARPEAIKRYWQALDLLEGLPSTPEQNRLHVETICSLLDLPGWARDNAAKVSMLRHMDEALALATEAGELATIARIEARKGINWEDEGLLIAAMGHAEASGDALVRRYTAHNYAAYLGKCARYATALDYIARARDTEAPKEQLFWLNVIGRCFSARAGKVEEALTYATAHRAMAEELQDARMQVWSAMEAEPHLYMGHWDKVTEVAERWLPMAWEIREWPVVLWSSAWLAIAYLKLQRPERAGPILARVFADVPARTLVDINAYATLYAHVAATQLHLQTGDAQQALSAAQRAVASSQQIQAPLEEGAAYRVLGEAYGAIGASREEADAAFRNSLALLEKIQSPPELAQTLLAYGRFRRGDNAREDRKMIERALKLFEEMGATGWVAEARAALDFTERTFSNTQSHNAT